MKSKTKTALHTLDYFKKHKECNENKFPKIIKHYKDGNYMLNVKYPDIQNIGCFELAIATFAKYINRPFELIFLANLNFVFNHNHFIESEKFADSFFAPIYINCVNYLHKFHGIELVYYPCVCFDETKQYFHDQIHKNEMPVITHLSDYWNPYSPKYQKFDVNHLCIACDMNDKGITCVDTYSLSEPKLIEYDYLEKGTKYIYKANIHDLPSLTAEEIINDLKSNLKSSKLNVFDEIRKFAK